MCQVLSHGQQLWLEDEQKIWQIEQGRVGVYAVKSGEADAYQQIFLLEAGTEDFLFGLPDSSDGVQLMAVAMGDVQLTMCARSDFQNRPEELRKMLSRWLNQAVAVRWLSNLVKFQDDIVMAWTQEDVFGDCHLDTAGQVWEKFDDSQDILAILAEGQFAAQRKNRSQQVTAKSRLRKKLLLSSSASLLDRKDLQITVQADGAADLPMVSLVRLVAEFLQLPATNIAMTTKVAAKTPEFSLLRQLVRSAGIQIRLVTLEKKWFESDCGVMLGYFGQAKELVAMLPVEAGKYRLYGSQWPAGVVVDKEIAGQMSGDAFVCYAGLQALAVSNRQLFQFMLKGCWATDWWTILATSVVAGIVPLLTPLVIETIFSDIVPTNDRQALGTVTQVMLIAAFTTAAVSYARSIAIMRIKSHINMKAEAALWSRLLSLPAAFFRKYQAGDLVQRMEGVTEMVETVSGTAVTTVFNLLFSGGSIAVMAYYNWKLTAITLGFWALYLLVSALIYWKTLQCRRKMVELSGMVAGQVLQLFNGLSKFRMAGGEERAFYLWARLFGEEWQWNLKTRQQNNYMEVVNAVQPLLLMMAIYYLTMHWLNDASGKQTMAYAEFLGFLAAFTSFNAILIGFVPMVAELINVRPQLERLQPVLACEPESSDDKADMAEIKGHIEFADVSFRYRLDGPLVLDGISFQIAAGQSIAIVGTSGCGKSTLVRLLLGFEKPEKGEILIDRQDTADINMTSVRRQLGVVLQNGQLLSGDIFTNIVGTQPLTLDDAWEAAEMVGLAEDIRAMPMGMNTFISEGATNISGGQRQRILLARSLVNKPRVVIMDEATSALDNTTQAIVTASVNRLNATRLIIAHRLSTIRDVDKIMVMDKGKIVEEGTFEQLMEGQGLFARMAERQLA